MKLRLLFLLIAAALAGMLPSCATRKTTTTAPDGTVTVTEESAPAIKDDTKAFATDVFWAFAPRQRPVHETTVQPTK